MGEMKLFLLYVHILWFGNPSLREYRSGYSIVTLNIHMWYPLFGGCSLSHGLGVGNAIIFNMPLIWMLVSEPFISSDACPK